MIETGCCSKIDAGLARSAPSVAAAVVAAMSGEDGVWAIRPGPGETPMVPLMAAGLFCRRAARAPRFRLTGVWIPRSKRSGAAGGIVVDEAITAACGCAKRKSRRLLCTC
ncbi:hypothetical protein HZ326_25886 [Fusarium oxysporum f. sp. albedinis]|nr:hypothetical protein HZ326_25886 [Fusarium oxysporum f. sp. albedinis]